MVNWKRVIRIVLMFVFPPLAIIRIIKHILDALED